MELESIPEKNESDAKILMRQTTYTLDECAELLKTKTLEDAIKDFFGIVEKKDESGSTNQKIYKLIRANFNS
jgi:hypothetical protein